MRKPVRKSSKKTQKNNFEERFAAMVKEYQEAKGILDSMAEGSSEYLAQKKHAISFLQTRNDTSIRDNEF